MLLPPHRMWFSTVSQHSRCVEVRREQGGEVKWNGTSLKQLFVEIRASTTTTGCHGCTHDLHACRGHRLLVLDLRISCQYFLFNLWLTFVNSVMELIEIIRAAVKVFLQKWCICLSHVSESGRLMTMLDRGVALMGPHTQSEHPKPLEQKWVYSLKTVMSTYYIQSDSKETHRTHRRHSVKIAPLAIDM